MKRLILTLLTVITLVPLLSSLWASFQAPQVQGQLELYQTNLVLQAAEYDPDSQANTSPEAIATLVEQLTGRDPYGSAIEKYHVVLESSQELLKKQQATTASGDSQALQEITSLIDGLSLKLGILEAISDRPDIAADYWQTIDADNEALETLIAALEALWINPSPSIPIADTPIDVSLLDSWFQQQTLRQLYRLSGDQPRLQQINQDIQRSAQQAFFKLTLVTLLPFTFGIFGLGFLIYLVVQRLRQRQTALLYLGEIQDWDTPWDGDTIWQVFIVGFFLVGQIILPLTIPVLLSTFQLDISIFTVREKAFYTLVVYGLMAGFGLLVLSTSIWSFRPFPQGWFQVKWLDNWPAWGFGGYIVALPSVLLVSLLNQQIWQGQGGSNPILFLALKAQDQVALTFFFITASVLAPLFEEIMFRGFLLASLTRYLPVWGSIILSAFIFAIAHMSLSEVLPLMTLGLILGFVYVKSRNLLAPMFLHSLWNSGTLLSLFILGS